MIDMMKVVILEASIFVGQVYRHRILQRARLLPSALFPPEESF